jgi:hypothetical protein
LTGGISAITLAQAERKLPLASGSVTASASVTDCERPSNLEIDMPLPILRVAFLASLLTAMPTCLFGQTGENHVVSDLPGTLTNGANINNLLGANRFYDAGFTGQGTITANVEAGHVWNGHESLQHVSQFSHSAAAFGTTTQDLFDLHATSVGGLIGGRSTAGGGAWQMGIAPGTDLRSGAMATGWRGSAYARSFGINQNSIVGAYQPFFGTADVINSSWGGGSPAGNSQTAILLDGFAAQNSGTTFVVAAGNSGPASNTVGFPGSGYNAITVAALDNGGNNAYDTVAGFSSRGPNSYADPVNGTIVGVRAAVDIAAPGTNLTAAFYGGQTGGNNTTLAGSSNLGAGSDLYQLSVAGTSFSSPIVAGGVALLKSASYNTAALASNAASRDTLVVKSVLMNSSDKTVGWDNGQVSHANGLGGVSTTQSLDWAVGAGKMNLDQAFDQYLTAGTRDVLGLANGNLGTVSAVGWDYGNVALGGSNFYSIGSMLKGNSLFNITLNWFRDRALNPITLGVADFSQANLTLRVWDLLTNSIISESSSLYNTAEHLSFLLPRTSQYGIEVLYGNNTFGNSLDANYGLAWSASATAVPEPSSLALLVVSSGMAIGFRLKRKK